MAPPSPRTLALKSVTACLRSCTPSSASSRTLRRPPLLRHLSPIASPPPFLPRCISGLSLLSTSSSDDSTPGTLFDTLALVRKLESQGFNAKQAEAITAAMTDVLHDCLQNVSDSFVSKSELQKYNMVQEAAYEKLQADVQSSQEKRMSSIQRDSEKLRTDIEKLKTEIRYEMDKVAAGQRLDLNLERGRIKEELAKQGSETCSLTNRLDKEINSLKTQLEASKYEVIKYCVGTIVSVYALGLALLRIFK